MSMAVSVLRRNWNKFLSNVVRSKTVDLYTYRHSVRGCSNYIQMKDALNNYEDIVLTPFRVGSCAFGESFSNAQIQIMQYLQDKNGAVVRPLFARLEDIINSNILTPGVEFSSVFDSGFSRINNHVLNFGGNLQKDVNELNSDSILDSDLPTINALAKFLTHKDVHEQALRVMFYRPGDLEDPKDMINESDVTVLLANHLFSQLATKLSPKNTQVKDWNEKYMINKDIIGKKKHCPCSRNCGAEIVYGDTKFGSEFLWYGPADLMVFPAGGGACSFVVPHTRDDNIAIDDEPEDTERPITEVKSEYSAIRNYHNRQQIVAQAITFSMLQNKFQKSKGIPVSPLVPTIAACRNAFDIYLYDFENDILLMNMGDPIPLFERNYKLNTSGILQLWMLINHASFRPSLDGEAHSELKKTCGLHEHTDIYDETSLRFIMNTLDMRQNFRPVIDEIRTDVHVKIIDCRKKRLVV